MLWMIWLNNIKIRIYIKKKIIDYRRFRILEYYFKWNEIINLIAPGNWYTCPSHRIIFKDYKNEKLILRIKPKKYEYNQKK